MTNHEDVVEKVTDDAERKQIADRLRKVCLAMADLASRRVVDLGLETSVDRGLFHNVRFNARYFDADSPHTDKYQERQKATLDDVRSYSSGKVPKQIREVVAEELEELEAYDAIPLEQRRGGEVRSEFAFPIGRLSENGSYEFDIEDISVFSSELAVPNIQHGLRVIIDPDALKIDAYRSSYRNSSHEEALEAIKRAVEVFERADEEDIRVTLPITI